MNIIREQSLKTLRDKLELTYTAIPWWKKVLICCVFKRKKWKLARAYNKVACSMLNSENWEIGAKVRDEGDKLWAEIYDIPLK